MSSALASWWSKTAMAQRKACSDKEAASWIPFKAIFKENVICWTTPQLDVRSSPRAVRWVFSAWIKGRRERKAMKSIQQKTPTLRPGVRQTKHPPNIWEKKTNNTPQLQFLSLSQLLYLYDVSMVFPPSDTCACGDLMQAKSSMQDAQNRSPKGWKCVTYTEHCKRIRSFGMNGKNFVTKAKILARWRDVTMEFYWNKQMKRPVVGGHAGHRIPFHLKKVRAVWALGSSWEPLGQISLHYSWIFVLISMHLCPEPPWIQYRLDRINSFYLNPKKFDTLKMCWMHVILTFILVQQWVKIATYAKTCIVWYSDSMHLGASGILSIKLYQPPRTTLVKRNSWNLKKGHPKDRIASSNTAQWRPYVDVP